MSDAIPQHAARARFRRDWRRIGFAALLAGTLDLVFACTWWGVQGVSPLRIGQSIAAGVMGPASFQGGMATATLGAGLHYAIMLGMAAAYFLAARRLPALRTRPLACGALYGLLLYAVMNHVVVPLSAAGPGPDDTAWMLASIAAHVLLVGIPIAWLARDARPAG